MPAGSLREDTQPDEDHRIRLRSGMLGGLFTLAIFYTLYFASALFIPIALALLLNLLLAPIVRALKKYLHLPEGIGAGLVLMLVLATVVLSFYSLSGPATRWLAELPVAMKQVERKLETFRKPVEEMQQAAEKVADLADTSAPGATEPVAVAIQGPSLTQMFLGGAMTLGCRPGDHGRPVVLPAGLGRHPAAPGGHRRAAPARQEARGRDHARYRGRHLVLPADHQRHQRRPGLRGRRSRCT